LTSILSSISGYFSKSLILGTFLPVAIFIVLALVLLVPYLPPDIVVSLPLERLGEEWKVIGGSFVAVVLSGLIYNLNIPILRLFEGYPWENSWIGSQLKKRHRARFDAAQLRVQGMRAAIRSIDEAVKNISEKYAKPKDREESAEDAEKRNAALIKASDFVRDVMANLKTLGDRRGFTISESTWLQAWRLDHQTTETDEIVAQARAIRANLNGVFSKYRMRLSHAYPADGNLILPTRLGNVIRSFEYYSHREYGIDSIEIWPRLVAVIPKEYAVSIDDSKTTFDFMLNSSLLSLLLCSFILIAGLVYPAPLSSFPTALYWIVKILSLALLSYFFYRLSIPRADAWGLLIKSAFDLYRWELLKKLGYAQQPKQRLAERALWGEISRQAIYGDRFDKGLLDYTDPAPLSFPSVQSVSENPKLEITRGVKPAEANDALVVYLRIKNTDSKAAVKGVIVQDRLSEDLEFEWDSARVGSNKILMSGINPYKFQIGDLRPDGEAILTYKALSKRGRDVSLHLA